MELAHRQVMYLSVQNIETHVNAEVTSLEPLSRPATMQQSTRRAPNIA
jgi:hypothetical protein